jgi:hypothetical protein
MKKFKAFIKSISAIDFVLGMSYGLCVVIIIYSAAFAGCK